MKTILIIIAFAALGYGVWWFFQEFTDRTAAGSGATRQSESALRQENQP
jgi:hypothetical protein